MLDPDAIQMPAGPCRSHAHVGIGFFDAPFRGTALFRDLNTSCRTCSMSVSRCKRAETLDLPSAFFMSPYIANWPAVRVPTLKDKFSPHCTDPPLRHLHEETSSNTSKTPPQSELLSDLHQAADSALSRQALCLVDLAEHCICRLRDNCGSHARHQSRS